MSPDGSNLAGARGPDISLADEARRQLEICNACRYCEGLCAVFPAITLKRGFAEADVTQLANLCHNCRGCYYSCQYTEPHEFALNLPGILADVRTDSWERLAWPGAFSRLFQRSGAAIAGLLVAGFALMFMAIQLLPGSGTGFYANLGHVAMVAIFVPAFLLPLFSIFMSLRRYWAEVGAAPLRMRHLADAFRAAATMRNLSGGQGQGCNFEQGDRYSNARRHAHHAMMWGFLMCFAATGSATVMHYVFGLEAPYAFFSLPKLLGVPGGILMVIGGGYLTILKARADRSLGAADRFGAETAFVLLLVAVAATGLALYAATGTALVAPLLAVHLGAVLTLFLLMPFSKMAHGFYRLAALAVDAQTNRG